MSELLDTINCPRCGLGIDVHVPSRHVEAREAEVEQWAATVDRVTRERDDEHLARVKAEARVRELEAAIRGYFRAGWGLDPVDPAVARNELESVGRRAALAAVSAEKEES